MYNTFTIALHLKGVRFLSLKIRHGTSVWNGVSLTAYLISTLSCLQRVHYYLSKVEVVVTVTVTHFVGTQLSEKKTKIIITDLKQKY